MHDTENFEDLLAQSHGQGLGAEANTKDLPAKTETKYFITMS